LRAPLQQEVGGRLRAAVEELLNRSFSCFTCSASRIACISGGLSSFNIISSSSSHSRRGASPSSMRFRVWPRPRIRRARPARHRGGAIIFCSDERAAPAAQPSSQARVLGASLTGADPSAGDRFA
jgi:hypothetical protein